MDVLRDAGGAVRPATGDGGYGSLRAQGRHASSLTLFAM